VCTNCGFFFGPHPCDVSWVSSSVHQLMRPASVFPVFFFYNDPGTLNAFLLIRILVLFIPLQPFCFIERRRAYVLNAADSPFFPPRSPRFFYLFLSLSPPISSFLCRIFTLLGTRPKSSSSVLTPCVLQNTTYLRQRNHAIRLSVYEHSKKGSQFSSWVPLRSRSNNGVAQS